MEWGFLSHDSGMLGGTGGGEHLHWCHGKVPSLAKEHGVFSVGGISAPLVRARASPSKLAFVVGPVKTLWLFLGPVYSLISLWRERCFWEPH